MISKHLLLSLLLIVGFTFNNCAPDCHFPDPYYPYFDIEGLTINNYNNSADVLLEYDVINFSDYRGFTIIYDVAFVASLKPKTINWNLGLLNSAYACSPPLHGESGSKTEKLRKLTILTVNDFDEEHLANDTINDILALNYAYPQMSLNEYLEEDTSFIKHHELPLKLEHQPVLNDTFQVKIIVELSTNEVYEAESEAIILN